MHSLDLKLYIDYSWMLFDIHWFQLKEKEKKFTFWNPHTSMT